MVTVGESPVQVRTRFLLNFVQGFFVSVLVSSLLLPLALDPTTASACRFKTSPPVHTETFGIDPRRRVGIYARFFFPRFFFSVPHHTHRTPNINTTPYHTSQRPQRDRERETEREKEIERDRNEERQRREERREKRDGEKRDREKEKKREERYGKREKERRDEKEEKRRDEREGGEKQMSSTLQKMVL